MCTAVVPDMKVPFTFFIYDRGTDRFLFTGRVFNPETDDTPPAAVRSAIALSAQHMVACGLANVTKMHIWV